MIRTLLNLISLMRRKLIHKLCNKYLGIDFTPLDETPDIVGCAEAVTTLLQKAGAFNRVIPGTWTLNEALKRDPNWEPTPNPGVADIIISPTGTSSKKKVFPGHVGIVGENGTIYSNDSYTGKWQANYTIDSWRARYERRGGYPVLFYRYNLKI